MQSAKRFANDAELARGHSRGRSSTVCTRRMARSNRLSSRGVSNRTAFRGDGWAPAPPPPPSSPPAPVVRAVSSVKDDDVRDAEESEEGGERGRPRLRGEAKCAGRKLPSLRWL